MRDTPTNRMLLVFRVLWTLESGVSRLRGHPEGPESCQPGARRPSQRSSPKFPLLFLQCRQCRTRGWDWLPDVRLWCNFVFGEIREVASRGPLDVLLKKIYRNK
jgi:hypothetical protein